jgi:hypothetical protein
MDGQDGAGQRKKPHGNPCPKRGAIKQGIIGEWFPKKEPGAGNGGSDVDKGNGGGGDAGGTAAAGYGG